MMNKNNRQPQMLVIMGNNQSFPWQEYKNDGKLFSSSLKIKLISILIGKC